MNVNDTLVIHVTDMNENGFGVARVDGLVIFVPDLAAGDTALIRIVEQRKNYAIGECLQVTEESPHRTKRICPVSDSCGGCTLCGVSFEYENTVKKNTVSAAFRRAGLDAAIVEDTVFPVHRTGYRNKAGFHYDPESRAFVYYREESNTPVLIDECHILPAEMNEILRFTNENIELLDFFITKSLFIRSDSTGKHLVSLYADGGDISAYKSALMSKFPYVKNVLLCKNEKEKQIDYLNDVIAGVKMRFSTESFRQVNTEAFSTLLDLVHSLVGKLSFTKAVDLYCGSGIIGLSLAKKFPGAMFWGIEINSDAIRDAKHNAEINGIHNITFFCGDAAAFREKIGKDNAPEFVVVDPPRAGLSPKMREGLVAIDAKHIVYVSCNPQTLARDLSSLRDRYEICRAVPVNMFPMTKHCECVVMLKRK